VYCYNQTNFNYFIFVSIFCQIAEEKYNNLVVENEQNMENLQEISTQKVDEQKEIAKKKLLFEYAKQDKLEERIERLKVEMDQ